MGFDDGPDSLPLGSFEPFGGEAKPGGKPLLAPNPPSELIVGFHHSRLTIDPVTVQETGRLMASFRSNATGTPLHGARNRQPSEPLEACDPLRAPNSVARTSSVE